MGTPGCTPALVPPTVCYQELIGPVSQALLAKGCIDRWFFIRYADPDEHIRWRLHVAGEAPRPCTAMSSERSGQRRLGRLVRRLVSTPTSARSSRYGGDAGVDAAERYFWIDSEAIIQLLHPQTGIGPDVRWRAVIPGIDTLLSDFRLRPGRQAAFDANAAATASAREFHTDTPFSASTRGQCTALRRQAGTCSRSSALRHRLHRLHRRGGSGPSIVAPPAREKRSTMLRAAGTRETAGSFRLPCSRRATCTCTSTGYSGRNSGPTELVIYDFLSCLYESRAARLHINAS